MKNLWVLVLIAILFVSCNSRENQQTSGNKPTSKIPDNPLFNIFNNPIDYASLTDQDIRLATESIQVFTNNTLKNIISVKDEEKTFENTMGAFDQLYGDYASIAYSVYLMAYTHPDSLLRNTALESNTILGKFGNDIALNENLYKAIKSYSMSDEAKNLNGHRAKFLTETVARFERNGFALSKEGRDQLKTINNELSTIGDLFSKNIAAYNDFLIVNEAGMDGLPEDYKEARKQNDKTYKVDLSYPSYVPFMKYAHSDKVRKELYIKFMNRAVPENLDVLQQLIQKRLEMANLLGYDTYAAYALEDKMAKNPSTVWEFINNLILDLRAKTKMDTQEILEIKKEHGGDSELINAWESSYYTNILLKEKYQVDNEIVKQYFALDDVIDGLFSITQTLFELQFKEVKKPSVWHEEVRMFEVYQDNKLKGIFYLDLFPRANKYTHAACFGIKHGMKTNKGYQIPMASLVCNFPKGTADKPALMSHREVEIFFHEFGHVLHELVTTAELFSQSGTNVAQDFVEAPSQIFENWVWNYNAVKRFAKHYKTREVMPEELFNKMLASKNVGSGINATTQLFLGTLDFTLYDKYMPNGKENTTHVLRALHNKIMPFPYVEGTHFQASFGHLYDYGSSYYGYLWSLVYAQDMYSIFEKNGVLDKTTGLRYRDIIMARGDTENALNLVEEFLGREPNNNAFLKELGL